VGIREAFALDRHRCPGRRANGEDGSGGLGRTDLVAVAQDLEDGGRGGGGRVVREEEARGGRLVGGEAQSRWRRRAGRSAEHWPPGRRW
jgi:hypothetical protein